MPASAQDDPARVEAPPRQRTPLILPMYDRAELIGEVPAAITPDGAAMLPVSRLLTLLEPRLGREAFERLRAQLGNRSEIAAGDSEGLEITIAYDPSRLVLDLSIPAGLRAGSSFSVIGGDPYNLGPAEPPAGFSAFITARTTVDYVHQSLTDETGAEYPTTLLFAAARAGGVVVEAVADWRPGDTVPFQRQATRLVYDNQQSPFRITAGDLIVIPRGFQTAPDMAGVSILRAYHVLQPMRIVRPSGGRSFLLTNPANVEIQVNRRTVRQMRLEPGNYDLRDFPFTEGANDVRVLVDDGTGSRELLNFDIFYDSLQLQEGLTEFGLFAGVRSTLEPSGPAYTDEWLFSGYVRHAVSDYVTLGASAQGDERSQMAEIDALWSSPIGLFGAELAASRSASFGSGWAARGRFERSILGTGSITATFETRSRAFAPLDSTPPINPFVWEATAGASHAFSAGFYGGIELSYSKGRGPVADRSFYRANVGVQVSPRMTLDVRATRERSPDFSGTSVLVSLTTRIGGRGTGQAEYDGRYDRGRLSYTTYRGNDVGAWNASADVSHGAGGGGANATFNYTSERAALSLNHLTTWDENFGSIVDQRSSAGAAFSLAFADGAFAVARPIVGGFAMIEPHATLGEAEVIVDSTEWGHVAKSGALGPAVVPNLTAYADRLVFVEPVDAPPGYDIGSGRYRLVAPYRGGYRITVGSDYWMTVTGRLLRIDGQPLQLVAGTATEVEGAGAQVSFFSNRTGRFSLSGLRPGRWRLEMLTEPPTVYLLEVPESEDPIVSLADLRPIESEEPSQ